MESIEDRLQSSFEEKFGSRPELSDGLAFIGVDSVGMAELTVEIEKEFGIKVQDDIVHADSVQDLADYIRERLQAKNSQ
ncbi:MAG: phosphopantetheine-binding protein [Pirellulaceae bacterium]